MNTARPAHPPTCPPTLLPPTCPPTLLPAHSSGSFDAYAGMPYELRALECALAAATRLLDSEVLDLEREAYPAIDRMAVSVSAWIFGGRALYWFWNCSGSQSA
jgi:hypothetical protein